MPAPVTLQSLQLLSTCLANKWMLRQPPQLLSTYWLLLLLLGICNFVVTCWAIAFTSKLQLVPLLPLVELLSCWKHQKCGHTSKSSAKITLKSTSTTSLAYSLCLTLCSMLDQDGDITCLLRYHNSIRAGSRRTNPTAVKLLSQNRKTLPPQNLSLYWKSYEVKSRKFAWEYQTKHLLKDLFFFALWQVPAFVTLS